MRGAVTRRSLDQNAPERKSGRAAFKNARNLFEAPSYPNERGDEEYGNTVYAATAIKEEFVDERTDDSSNTKSINDLIKVRRKCYPTLFESHPIWNRRFG